MKSKHGSNCTADSKVYLKDYSTPTIHFPTSCTIEDLVGLAIECEKVVFDESETCPSPISRNSFLRTLVDYSRSSSKGNENPATTTAATLLALNALESCIRNATGYATGRAPLLKTMIQQIPDEDIACAAELLLLPHGLNLRNLVWHGFVPELPRHWLATVVVLATNLQGDDDYLKHDSPLEMDHRLDLKNIPGFKSVFDGDDRQRMMSSEAVLQWLPKTHHGLWHLASKWYGARKRPVSLIAILSILLEHGLRLTWCRLNERPDDAVAAPSEYYVTLDGHGQRHIHNLLLHPYLLEDESRNQLIEYLPGGIIALITDLFCSSCGGPNLRSKISHGNFDRLLFAEWVNNSNGSGENDADLWQTARAVMLAFHLIASMGDIDYCPVFSYTAVCQTRVQKAQALLEEIRVLQESDEYVQHLSASSGIFDGYTKNINILPKIFVPTPILPHQRTHARWTTNDVFTEYESNVRLANAGAARKLLQDIEIVTTNHMKVLKDALGFLNGPQADSDKRKYKRALRIVHSSQVTYLLYRFCFLVALLCLKERTMDDEKLRHCRSSTTLKAVERSRMVISTVDNFLHADTERALRCIRDYDKAKKTKDIICAIRDAIL